MKTEHKQTVMISLMRGHVPSYWKEAAATELIKAKAGKRQINYSSGMRLHGVYTNNLSFPQKQPQPLHQRDARETI